MTNNLRCNQYPLGSALLLDPESFLHDLTEEDESIITGGKRTDSRDSNTRRRKRRRRRRKRDRSRT